VAGDAPTTDAREFPGVAPVRVDPVEGARIGRYIVLDVLGSGGMGVVVAAYDPTLDRKVAVKLIDARHRGDAGSRLRMEREAQAMARLSHPNVVTIYEVGEHEGDLFLAMEFVKGRDLCAWLRERRVDWRQVLEVFIQAGRGLAAAHRVGIVHRDFKPANVLVGDDGRVRVGDFGLARQGKEVDDEVAVTRERVQVSSDSLPLGQVLTRAGSRVGTPAYMAPEQLESGTTDMRSDQFAFCVALWEALYGRRPFTGDTELELLTNMIAGRREPPPAGRSAPSWLRRALDRGLSLAPDSRYPTMDAILAALQADPTRRRRIVAAVAAAALAGAGGLGLQHYRESQQVAACAAAGASIDAVWNEVAESRLRHGLLATDVSYAEQTAERVMPYLAAQADAWRAARTESCLDAKVRGTWDTATLLRSEWCLEERRIELATMVTELSQATPRTVQNAVFAVAGLEPIEPCRDAQRLARAPALPHDRRGVEAVLVKISRVEALQVAGDYEQALLTAREAIEGAKALGSPALVASARVRSGQMLGLSGMFAEAEATLADAYFGAFEAGALEIAADAAMLLSVAVGYVQARPTEGRWWSRHATAILSILGIGEDDPLRARALATLASVQDGAGELAEAKALGLRALAIYERALGPDHPAVATALNNVAGSYGMMGDYAEAKAMYARALAIRERALGPDHPYVATALSNLGTILQMMGEIEPSRPLFERALAIRERVLGREHPDLADPLDGLAEVQQTAGAYEAAKALHERALAIREAKLGPVHPYVAVSLVGLAEVALAQGRPLDAIPLAERSVKIREGVGAVEELAEVRFVLARALWDAPDGQGRDRERALALARQAGEVLRGVKGKERELAAIEGFLKANAGGPTAP
jgi:tetratricopeptide (TPR) repeat protein/predicted Ser/Thr protein kinase